MKILSQREKKVLILCQVIAVMFFLDLLVIKPLMQTKENVGVQIASREKQLEQYAGIIGQYAAIKKEYDEYGSYFKQKKLNEEEVSSVLANIDSLAKRFEVNISDLKPGKVKEEGSHSRFSFELFIDGDLTQVLNFIHSLENKPYFFSVDGFRFERKSRHGELIKCRLSLKRIMIP